MGYVLLHDPPVGENWGNYVMDPTLLSSEPRRLSSAIPARLSMA